ncbi:ATP-binding protein [Microbacterium sp.]|uniref:ATP-binding protein n=1 Tax=Microbacterium sp. TaxID=51671 RepID=UPI0039E37BCA
MSSPYERRVVDAELDELFSGLAAIAIDGAKGVGKTTTAAQRAATTLRLDDPLVQQAIGADPAGILPFERPLLIDEWQRAPAVWDVVRRAVDDDRRGEQFLLTGSATPRAGATAHSGAGRIVRLRMRPLALSERGFHPTISLADVLRGGAQLSGTADATLADYAREIVSSGFPGIRDLPPRQRRAQLAGYVENIVDREIPEAGITVRRPHALLHWLRAYAAATSTTASYTRILDSATAGFPDKPTRNTTAAYRDALEQLWILDPVGAWAPAGAELGRLAQAPKHQLADPAIAASLMGFTSESLARGSGGGEGHAFGDLFESLVTLCLRVYAQRNEATVSHFRDRNGEHEVDLIVSNPDGSIIAFEVKLSGSVDDRDVRHLKWLRERLGEQLIDAIVINTGPMAYRRPDGIGVVPLALLGM